MKFVFMLMAYVLSGCTSDTEKRHQCEKGCAEYKMVCGCVTPNKYYCQWPNNSPAVPTPCNEE